MIRHTNYRTAAPNTTTGSDWTQHGNCADVDLDVMFPGTKPRDIAAAQAVCAGCPVTDECLSEALRIEGNVMADRRHGVFGGLTGKQRRRVYEELERRRKAAV
ncbi:WhiB family transcriptional regulator [Streptomyces sp. NPDC055059]